MLSIGTFSKLSNVTTKTIRYYSDIGLLVPVYVNLKNGYRYYSATQLKTMLLINRLKQYSFSLEEIAEVLKKDGDEEFLYTLLTQKKQSVQKKINYYNYILKQLEKDASNLERGKRIMSYLDDIKIELVETKPKNVLFLRDKINVKNFGELIGKLFQTAEEKKLTIIGAPIAIYHDEEYNPENYDTEVAIPVLEDTEGTRIFESGLCAMATLRGNYSNLTAVYAELKKWVTKLLQ